MIEAEIDKISRNFPSKQPFLGKSAIADISQMPKIKYSWELDYKPAGKNRTGHNLLLKTVPKCDWKDANGKVISKKKVSATMKEFAKLSKPLQAHI